MGIVLRTARASNLLGTLVRFPLLALSCTMAATVCHLELISDTM